MRPPMELMSIFNRWNYSFKSSNFSKSQVDAGPSVLALANPQSVPRNFIRKAGTRDYTFAVLQLVQMQNSGAVESKRPAE